MAPRVTRWVAPLLFVGLFLGLALRHPHFEPAELEIAGESARPLRARLDWDSGSGFNTFESKEVLLATDAALRMRPHRLAVQRLAGRNPASKSGEVWITGLETRVGSERRPVDLTTLAAPAGSIRDLGRICLTTDLAAVEYEGEFEGLQLVLVRHPFSGIARVSIDGAEHGVFDLYASETDAGPLRVAITAPPDAAAAPGPFTRTTALPQSRIRAIALESLEPGRSLPVTAVTIESARGEIALPIPSGAPSSRLVFEGLPPVNRAWSPVLLGIQAALALVLTWAVFAVAGLRRRLGCATWAGTLRRIFVEERRWVFWAMFAASTFVFSLWLLGWWPGLMTRDSLDTWLDTKRLDFHNWNPFVHALYVLVLTQLYDSPAIIAIVQLLATAALGSGILFFVYAHGVRFRWIAPFFLAFALSVPVAVYNLLIWKDVPFCLLTVFWACFLFALAYRRRVGDPLVPGRTAVVVLAALLVLVSTIRHNGLPYLVVIPAMMLLGGLLPRRRLAELSALVLVLYVGLQYGVGTAIGAHRNTNYRIIGLSVELNPWAALLGDRVGYYSDDPAGDGRILGALMDPDTLLRTYNPLTIVPLVYGDNRRDEISPDETRAITRRFVRRAAENLHIIMAERAYLFFATLGFRTWGYASNLFDRDLGGRDPETLAALRDAPRSQALRTLQAGILERSNEFRGLSRGSFLFWNAFIPLVPIVVVFLLYGWLPLTALACAVILVQVAVLFATLISNDFRYVYFVQLFGYFLVPLLLLELHLIRAERRQARVRSAAE
jgi:hypothetical protein